MRLPSIPSISFSISYFCPNASEKVPAAQKGRTVFALCGLAVYGGFLRASSLKEGAIGEDWGSYFISFLSLSHAPNTSYLVT